METAFVAEANAIIGALAQTVDTAPPAPRAGAASSSSHFPLQGQAADPCGSECRQGSAG